MAAPATLTVAEALGVLRLRFEVFERDTHEPLQPEFRQTVDAATLAALIGRAEALLRGPERADFAAEARARGSVLYRTLVPVPLGADLREHAGPLVVSTPLQGVPWEMLHDGEEFWGLRYPLGRRLVFERPGRAAARGPARARPRALVVGVDPRGDLPFVADEVESVCDALARIADVDAIGGRLATFDAVVAALGRGYDLVHWCGHVVADGREPALLLAGETRLPASAIEASLAGRPLVFVNGCASASGQAMPGTAETDSMLATAAHAFLLGGALAVVGTLGDVGDRHAATLADEFYRGALDRAPIGEALRAARAKLRESAATAASPIWLSTALYGNPAQVLPRSDAAPVAFLPPGGRRGDEAGPPARDVSREPERPGAGAAPREPGRPSLGTPLREPGPLGVDAVPGEAPAPAAIAVPTPPAAPTAVPRRRWRVALIALVLLVVALVVGLGPRFEPAPAGPVAIGVMGVRTRGAQVPEWMRELTRDALNTVLSRVPAVRVYSRQKIDFLRERRSLSEIEAAEALGLSKMLSASIGLDAGQVTLDLEVIDTATGVLEASERVQGPEGKLIELQTELALRALDALGVHPTEADLKAIAASRASETLEAYRLLAETLGDAPRDRPPGDVPPPDPTAPLPAAPERPGQGSRWFGWQSVAWAQPPDADEDAIRALLERYASAIQAKKPEDLAALQLEMSPTQRASLERYFAIATDLHVRVSDIDVLVDGPEAVATFTREDRFVDAASGRTMQLVVRVTGLLTKTPDGWRIRRLREPS